MCSKGGGSPPVPNSASTAFQSTTTPAPFATPLYQDFLNRANSLSQTPFNPAMMGQVAPLNAEQVQAGETLFNQGMHLGEFDPAKVQSLESPFTQDVVNATQNWFNNQNAIQGNDLLSQAIKSGNAFGGDRAGVGESILAGQQQLAQAPVIAGLYQSGYTQALNEYNLLKNMGMQGAQAALGWGGLQQQQQQREFDVAQQNAMMQSAYPFQTLNWYGAALGGIAPLLGAQTVGFNTPPEQSGLGAGLGAASAAVGLGSTAFGGGGGGAGPSGFRRGGHVRRARGGLVPVYIRHNGGIIPGLAYGGEASDDDDDERATGSPAGPPVQADEKSEDYKPSQIGLPPREHAPSWGSQITGGQNYGRKQTLPSSFPGGTGGGSATAPKSDTQSWLEFGKAALPAAAKLLPLLLVKRGGMVPHFQDGGSDEDLLTMTDLGVLDPQGRELSPGIAGPSRGSPGSNEGLKLDRETGRFSPVQQSEDMPNLARVRERFRPMLESNPALARKFDVNTTAEVGTDPAKRDFYQALTLDRAAARGESLPYTLSRGPGTPDRYYPGTTANARAASGQGVSPALWGGANPANYATGNASRDPVTGRDVGFAGGPQTGSAGAERGGIEGQDLAAARRFGYRGPSQTAIGWGAGAPQGTYGGDSTKEAAVREQYPEGAREKVGVKPGDTETKEGRGGPPDTGTGQIGRQIPGLAKPAPTFAQRLAQNPFWQFGTALMAKPGLKRYPLQGIGAAAQVMSAQQTQERDKVLDQKPQMFDDGKQMHVLNPDGSLTPTGIPSPIGINQKNALELQAAKHKDEEKMRSFTLDDGTKEEGFRQPDGTYIGERTGNVYGRGPQEGQQQSRQPAPGEQPRTQQPEQRTLTPPRQSELTPPKEGEQWPGTKEAAAQPPTVSDQPPAAPQGRPGSPDNPVVVPPQQQPPPATGTAGPAKVEVPDPPSAGGWSATAVKTAGENYAQTGKIPPGITRNRPLQAAITDYGSRLMASRGVDPEMWRFAPKQAQFLMGADGRTARSLGTLVDHLDTMKSLTTALKNNDNQTYNLIRNRYAAWMGDAAPTNVQAGAEIVGSEVMKAIGVAGAGTGRERDIAALNLGDLRKSPQQFAGAIDVVQKLAAGQMGSILRQGEALSIPPERLKTLVGSRALQVLSTVNDPQTQTQQPQQQTPVQVQTIDDVRKLEPGTKFIIPEGPNKGMIGTAPPRQ